MNLAHDTFGSSADPALLLLTGLGASRRQWRESFCAELATAGVFVVRIDNRDAGESPSCDHLGRADLASILRALENGSPPRIPYTLADMANDAVALVDSLELSSFHLCGASMGGTIALMMALEQPDRVRSVTTVSCGAGPEARRSTRRMALANTLAKPAQGEPAWIERAVHVWRSIGTPGDAADEDHVRELARIEAARGPNPDGYSRQLAALLNVQASSGPLEEIDVPVQLIVGDRDIIVSRGAAEHLADRLPNSTLVQIEEMGHDLPRRHLPKIATLVLAHLKIAGRSVAGHD